MRKLGGEALATSNLHERTEHAAALVEGEASYPQGRDPRRDPGALFKSCCNSELSRVYFRVSDAFSGSHDVRPF